MSRHRRGRWVDRLECVPPHQLKSIPVRLSRIEHAETQELHIQAVVAGQWNKSRKDVSESSNTSKCDESGKDEGDDGISKPWNFQVCAFLVILGVLLTPEHNSTTSTSTKGECIHCSRQ